MSSLEAKPSVKRLAKMAAPSRQRSKRRQREAPQVRMVLSREAVIYLEQVERRTGLKRIEVTDRLIREAQDLKRRLKDLGFDHVGELLAVFRELRGLR